MLFGSALIAVFALNMLTTNAFDERQLEQRLRIELEDYLETGQVSIGLEESLEEIQLPHFFRQIRAPNDIGSSIACFACRSIFGVIGTAARLGVSNEKIASLVTGVCSLLKIETEAVCRGAVNVNVVSQLEQRLRIELEDYLETGQVSIGLEESLEEIQLPHFFRQIRAPNDIGSSIACFACRSIFGVIGTAARLGVSNEKIASLVTGVCSLLKIETEAVCRGAVNVNVDTVLYIIKNKPSLTSSKICSVILQGQGCRDPDQTEWDIHLPPTKPYNNSKISRGSFLSVLQITDIHYDPEYTPGASAECQEPLCCQGGSTPKNPGAQAAKWGDYRDCDLPLEVLVDSLAHIVRQHRNIDFVYFTGDIINHKIWNTNVEENKLAIAEILYWFKHYFGHTPVFPILGNHEPHPVDLFTSEGVNEPSLATQWIFDLAAKEWQTWLPSETQDTILRGGYYTVSPKPGFRIMALNSNVCYTLNFWLLYDDVDPFGQLQWLADTLAQAEIDGEIVHILTHIPTGDGQCLHNWTKVYIKIINRFAHIIAAQFNGHTHYDETTIYFDSADPSKAINVAYNGGSLTPYSHLNPNYKVYKVDTETLLVLDYESWMYNITEANLTPNISPNWYKLYSFQDAYGVPDLSPQQLSILTEQMAKSPELTEKYFRYKYREVDTKLNEGCDDNCHISNLCYMVTSHIHNRMHCEKITNLYNSARPPSQSLH